MPGGRWASSPGWPPALPRLRRPAPVLSLPARASRSVVISLLPSRTWSLLMVVNSSVLMRRSTRGKRPRRRRDRLAGDEAGMGGHLVDDREPALDALGRVDDHGEDRGMALDRPEAFSVGSMFAAVAPLGAHGGGPGSPGATQPAHELGVDRPAFAAGLLAGLDHELEPAGQPARVGARLRER